jgi:hypothetical protein
MTATATTCTRCRSAPPRAPGMSTWRACLKKQVDAERREREKRRREWTKERRSVRRHSRPSGRQDK